MTSARGDGARALLIGILMFAAYNANGREIASFDSQPTKFAARELLLRGNLSLNFVVGARPQLLERPGFQLALDGRYRSAYSPAPAIAAAIVTWPLWKLGIIDIRAPRAPALMAALTASLLTAIAVAFAFLVARRWLGPIRALAVALGLGLGTGYWDTVSQTLWQHETVVFGLAIAVWGLTHTRPTMFTAAVAGMGLGIAAASRPQIAPMVVVMLAGVLARGGLRAGVVAVLAAGTLVLPLLWLNTRWFGTPFGAATTLEALHESIHGVGRSFTLRSGGFAGLLVSPNRGLLVFSPIAGIVLLAACRTVREGYRSPLLWCALAAAAQYVLYASYSVWWGGHTYGPRYLLDVLPVLVPLAAVAVERLKLRWSLAVLCPAVAWSVFAAGTGAFFYPNDRWNSNPVDIDRAHARLWDWNDMQILRCWERGPSPQNFTLFTSSAFRVERP